MAGYDPEPERAWDEYDWERFLQQQDHKTEKYMELLEKYLDHPERDQIIASEMGWTQLTGDEEWSEDFQLDADPAVEKETAPELLAKMDCIHNPSESFEDHKLYRSAFSLTIWIDRLFDDHPGLANEPHAVKMATCTALASAKLAAALSDDDVDEIGMTIAYLKRALKAITNSMEAAAALFGQHLITSQQHVDANRRLFQVRDGIISLMGEYRGEWRRRHGTL